VAVQWFVPEPGSEEATLLLRSDALFLAPDIMPVEAANAWWKKARLGEMSTEEVEHAARRLLAVGINLIPSAPFLARALRLASGLGHAVYDCVYLAVAAHQGARLATVDGRLRRSAERISVPVWRP
jgi:predicted nucleic acid-binding protein